MIEKLKNVGITFTNGLTSEELTKIEEFYGFHFPKEIAEFLSIAYPVGLHFFNYRNMSSENKKAFDDFQTDIKESFLFDIEQNEVSIKAMLSEIIDKNLDSKALANAVLSMLDKSPRLIPFYAHRCFFDGMNNMPIVSFYQAVDTIFYGTSFENYLENEFLHIDSFDNSETLSGKMKNTGIWHYIIN